MAGVASNWTRLVALIRSLPRAAVFDDGLGLELAKNAAHLIRVRSLGRQVDPKGRRWAANAESYARSAGKRGKPIGELSGEMLSEEQILGEPEITRDRVSLRYGKTEFAKKKARWFQQGVRARSGRSKKPGRRWRQPPREFYDLDPELLRQQEAFARAKLEARLGRIR